MFVRFKGRTMLAEGRTSTKVYLRNEVSVARASRMAFV